MAQVTDAHGRTYELLRDYQGKTYAKAWGWEGFPKGYTVLSFSDDGLTARVASTGWMGDIIGSYELPTEFLRPSPIPHRDEIDAVLKRWTASNETASQKKLAALYAIVEAAYRTS